MWRTELIPRRGVFGRVDRSRLLKLLICFILFLGTAGAYKAVSRHEFVRYDDGDYMTQNPPVASGLSLKSIEWAFTRFHSGNWHPLTWLSHMLDVQLWGLNAGGHHITNVLFHIANTVLVFFVFAHMTGSGWRSAFVAAIFAWHPLHVESVAWVSERKDVLSAFFWFLTIAAYLGYVSRPNVWRYLGVLGCYVAGLMSKPMVVTLPFVLLLLDYWPLQRAGLARGERGKWLLLVVEKIPFVVLAIASSVVTLLAQRKGGALIALDRLPFPVRLGNAFISYADYLLKAFWPVNLAVFYPMRDSLPSWHLAGAVLLLLAATTLAVTTARRVPFLIVGWLWFLGSLVPVIGIVQVGDQAMADRYMYIPLIGLSIIIAWGIPLLVGSALPAKQARPALVGVSGAVLVACLALTTRQIKYWHDSLGLFQHALFVTKNNWFAHGNIAMSLGRSGDIGGAIAHYRELLRIKPASVEALNNLAWHLATSRDDRYHNDEEALRLAGRALELSPDPDPSTLDTLAAALAANHLFEEAVQRAEQARDLAAIREDTELASRISARLALYEQGLVYRQ